MIGILESRASPDPDGQHGERLAKWLCENRIHEPKVLSFQDLLDHDLKGYQSLWWHHTQAGKLPQDALQSRCIEVMREYLLQGGKLFLSRNASGFVEPLGVDLPPDLYSDRPPPFFIRPGMHVEAPSHPLAKNLSPGLVTYNHLSMASFCDLRWKKKWPKRGRLLGTRMLNGALYRDEALFWEWQKGRGRILVFSGVGLHFYNHEDPYRPQLLALTADILEYLEQPCLLDFKPVEGLGVHLFNDDSYALSRLGDTCLAFDRNRPVSVEINLTPFQLSHPSLRLCLMDGERLCLAVNPDLASRDPGVLRGVMHIDSRDLEEGYYELMATVRCEGSKVHEESVLLLIKEQASRAFWHVKSITTFANQRSVLEIENQSGCAKGLFPKDHPYQLNFLANETNSILMKQEPPPWFGTLMGKGRYRSQKRWLEFSNRSSRIVLESLEKDRIRFMTQISNLALLIQWEYEVLPDRFRWSFNLVNQGDKDIEIGSLYFPVSLNTYFGRDSEQAKIYTQRVIMHNLICKRGSYLFAESLASAPPFLLVMPLFNEGFECMWHDPGRLKGCQPAWEGLLYAGIFTRAEQETRGFESWLNGHSKTNIPPGSKRAFSLDLFFIDSYDEINEILVQEGQVAFEPHPGMVVPVNMPSHCLVRSPMPFDLLGPKGVQIMERDSWPHATRYDLTFKKPGDYTLKVLTAAGESLYHYRAIPPLEQLVKARARFIAQNQQYRNPGAVRDYALLMWDSEEQSLVTNPEYAFLAGGSDEAGLADPVYLSAKQIFFPVEREIEVLEQYIEHFLFGKVQNRKDYGVRRWVSEPGTEDHAAEGMDIGHWTDRSFNYPHVFNIYYALFMVGKLYDMTRVRSAPTYLDMAARTALAYFRFGQCLHGATKLGNLGDRALELILEALSEEGLLELREKLSQAMKPKVTHLCETPYPYASEYSFDTTGYEGVYWIRSFAGHEGGVDSVMHTILGTRGKQPFWYHYGGDVRWGWGNSKFLAPDEICFNYMCGLNARVLLHAFFWRHQDLRFLKLGFAGTVAPWVLVEPNGTAHDFCGWEPGRVRFDPWSSEMGLGIAATLFALASIVILHEDHEPLGYGCALDSRDKVIHIEPRDGIQRRLVILGASGAGFHLSVDTALIRGARYEGSSHRLEVDLEPVVQQKNRCSLRVKPLGPGSNKKATLQKPVKLKEGITTLSIRLK